MRKNQTLIIAVALLLCSAVTAQAQRTSNRVCHSRDGHPTGSPRPDGWRKRDVRQRLAHFFHRSEAIGRTRQSRSTTPSLLQWQYPGFQQATMD